MGKKLFVGKLPFSATDHDLNEIFSQVGQVVSAKVIMDRETGRSKGFGFVEFSTDEEAANAISQFNGADYGGFAMVVNEARPMAPREGGPRGGFGGGGGGGFGGGRGNREGGFGGGRSGDRNNNRGGGRW
jgi:RNA recognition motif-containing protein